MDRLQKPAGARAQLWFSFKQRFRVERHWRNGVVDVMGDSASHLPQSAQTLLLHHALLCALQIFIRLLQRVANIGLVSG